MTIEELKKNKSIYLLGYGIEGKATHEFLKKFCPDVEIGIGDEKLDPDYLDKQIDYDLIIKSPGVRIDKIRGTYTTATNIFFANATQKIIGITGTKGKSTTATLIYNMLVKAGKNALLAGNIGVPMLDILTNDESSDSYVVLELSSYQLEDIAYAPHISIILNIYEELHNHASFDEYRKAKFMIAQQASEKDFLIYNPNLLELDELLSSTSAQKIPFVENSSGVSHNLSINDDSVKALLTLGNILDINTDVLQKTFSDFQNLPHRLQHVGVFNDILFIDDSAANHPQATVHALKSVENIATIILGGQDRGFDFSSVVHELKNQNIQHIILFPDTQEKIRKLLDEQAGYMPEIFYTDSMMKAVQHAFEHTAKHAVCIMSPGAPSYLMFSGFPARGEAFIQEVKTYAEKNITSS
jgi:UDP-N-acetylmuramoylalanine--D-glutamate ligase